MVNVAPDAPGVIKVQFLQHYGGAVNIINRLFFEFTGTLDQTSASTIASDAANAWQSAFASYLSTTYELDNVVVTDLGSSSGTQVNHPAQIPGTLPAADFLPASTNMCITGTIDRRYRGGKPRWYQCGHHQSSLQDNQTWTAQAIGNFEAGMVTLAGGIEGKPTTGGSVGNNINLSLVEGYTWTPYTTSSGKQNYRKDPVYRPLAVHDQIRIWAPLARVSTQRKRGVN